MRRARPASGSQLTSGTFLRMPTNRVNADQRYLLSFSTNRSLGMPTSTRLLALPRVNLLIHHDLQRSDHAGEVEQNTLDFS